MCDASGHVRLYYLNKAGASDGACDAEYNREPDAFEGCWGNDGNEVCVYADAYRAAYDHVVATGRLGIAPLIRAATRQARLDADMGHEHTYSLAEVQAAYDAAYEAEFTRLTDSDD